MADVTSIVAEFRRATGTGTNAPTRAGVDARSSHVYAVNPSTEPNTTRYASAASARGDAPASDPSASSPAAADTANSTSPPASTCAPVCTAADAGRGVCRA